MCLSHEGALDRRPRGGGFRCSENGGSLGGLEDGPRVAEGDEYGGWSEGIIGTPRQRLWRLMSGTSLLGRGGRRSNTETSCRLLSSACRSYTSIGIALLPNHSSSISSFSSHSLLSAQPQLQPRLWRSPSSNSRLCLSRNRIIRFAEHLRAAAGAIITDGSVLH